MISVFILTQDIKKCKRFLFFHFSFWEHQRTRALNALVLTDRYSASMIASILRYVSSGSALLVIERPTTM